MVRQLLEEKLKNFQSIYDVNMLLSPNAEVVVLYRTNVFSEWTNINHTSDDESAYFIKVTTNTEDLYFMLGTAMQSYHVHIE